VSSYSRAGEAEVRAGNTPAAKEAFLTAAGIARRLCLTRELARAAAGYGGRIVWGRAGEDQQLVPLLEEGLAALAEEDIALRARLLARLAGALRDEPSRARRDQLSREAVELARSAEEPAPLAYALGGRAEVICAPDTVAECLALSDELLQLAERIGDAERLLQGHCDRCFAHLQLGETAEAVDDLDAASHIAHELRQPAQLWQVAAGQAMLSLASGRLEDAEELSERAFEFGKRAQRSAATAVYRLQRYTLRDFEGRLGEELVPDMRELAAEHRARPVFRCALAYLYARRGRLREAKQTVDRLATDDFAAVPFDHEWLYALSFLAETVASLGDRDAAAILYRLLLPWAALNAVDQAEGIRGSVARYLGLLATTTERWDKAELHFEDALAMNARMGARPWLAHTANDYARMLHARSSRSDRERAEALLDGALGTYRELGMDDYVSAATALAEEVRATA
jgi:tetratricopeptide (TPR) repeat protein